MAIWGPDTCCFFSVGKGYWILPDRTTDSVTQHPAVFPQHSWINQRPFSFLSSNISNAQKLYGICLSLSLSSWNGEIYSQFLIKMTMTFSFVLLTVVKKYLSPHATITSLSHTRQKSHRSVDTGSWNVGFVSLSILLSGMNHARLMKLKQSQCKQSLDEKHQKLSNCWGLQSKLQLWITF